MKMNDQPNQKPFQHLTGTRDLFLFSKYSLFQLTHILVLHFHVYICFPRMLSGYIK